MPDSTMAGFCIFRRLYPVQDNHVKKQISCQAKILITTNFLTKLRISREKSSEISHLCEIPEMSLCISSFSSQS